MIKFLQFTCAKLSNIYTLPLYSACKRSDDFLARFFSHKSEIRVLCNTEHSVHIVLHTVHVNFTSFVTRSININIVCSTMKMHCICVNMETVFNAYSTALSSFYLYQTQPRRGCLWSCLLYTSPSPRDLSTSRMPSSA